MCILFPRNSKQQKEISMTMKLKILAIMLISLAALVAAGCPQRHSISDLERNPGKYNGKEVTVAGKVKSTFGGGIPGTGIGGGIYEIDDGTGTIWVVAQGSVPNKGAEVAASGTYGNAISWSGRNYGTGISEEHRHYHKR
jgi:hypothetical protein